MAGTISQRISLEGAEDISNKLKALAQAGEAAFKQIQDAASKPILDQAQFEQSKTAIDELVVACEKLSETLGTVSGAGDTAAEGVNNLAEATNKAAEATSKLTLENAKSGSEIVKNTAHAALYGAEIYALVAKHESLIVVLARMAFGTSATTIALEVLVGTLGATVVAIGGVTLGIGAAVIALTALAKAAEAVAAPYERLNNSLQTMSLNTGVAFDALQRGQAAFELLGVSAEGFRNVMTKIGEEIKNLDIGEAFKKSADDINAAMNEMLDSSVKNAAAAQKKFADATANNLEKVVEQVRAIEAGQKGITFDAAVTAETKIKALAVTMKEAADNGKAASTVLLQFIVNADRLAALSAGAKFGLKEEDVDRIRRAGAAAGGLQDILRRLDASGVLIPPEAAARFAAMREQIEATERAQIRLNQAWDSSIFASFGAAISTGLSSLKADFLNFVAASLEALTRFNDALGRAFDQMVQQILGALGGIYDAFIGTFRAVYDFIKTTIDNIVALINRAIDAIRQLLGMQARAAAAPSGGGGGLPMAGGGLVWGRGTGTSDSNLAWLSRGEYVTPAHAVRQPGVLALLEALRRSGGDLRHVLNGMGRFALGGMVMPGAIPAFAGGGLNGSNASRVLNLTIEGRSFSGLSVPESTAQALERFAVHSQIASAGRKPSWKR